LNVLKEIFPSLREKIRLKACIKTSSSWFKMNFSLLGINIGTYLLYFLFAVVTRNHIDSPAKYAESFFALAVIFVLGGLNITALLQVFLNKKFTRLEFVNISAGFAFLGVILINFVEMMFFHKYVLSVIMANSALIFLLGFFISKKILSQRKSDFRNPVFSFSKRDKNESMFFLLIVVIYTVVVGKIVAAYYALPDIDPYSWMLHTQACINADDITSCFGGRPLYEVLNLLFVRAAKIDLYVYFKYIFPFLSLLVVLPAVMVARRANTFAGKILIAILPLTVPSTLLYLLTPMPQAIAIILIFFFFYWLLYSHFSGNNYFYYLAGVISLFMFWYHEVGLFFFIGWFFVTFFRERKNILKFILTHRVTAAVFLTLLLSNLHYLQQPCEFVINWMNNLSGVFFHIKINRYFPAAYMNIDGSGMGWPGAAGVAKYYLFYAGPLVILLLLLSLMYTIKNRKLFLRNIVKKEYLVLFSLFVLFFFFAEITPRLFSLAFLPERIWIFAGIVVLFPIMHYVLIWKNKLIIYLLLIFAAIGVSGAIYVNQQKKFTLPDYRINAATWIRKNLPNDRIILSVGDKNLIRFYSKSRYYLMPSSFYCDDSINSLSTIWSYFSDGRIIYSPKQENIEKNFRTDLASYLAKENTPTISEVQTMVSEYLAQESSDDVRLGQEDLLSLGYIYYYRDDPRNPIMDRPYYQKKSSCEIPVFEKYPSSFRMIYNDKEMVKIWKIIK